MGGVIAPFKLSRHPTWVPRHAPAQGLLAPTPGASRVLVKPAGGTGGEVQMQMFKLITEYGDYYECKRWDGTTLSDTLFKVAKPWLLRRTPFDGVTYNGVTYTYTDNHTRTASDGVNPNETQKVTPDYVANDIIFGVTNIRGGTGVSSCAWLEVGSTRCWAVEP